MVILVMPVVRDEGSIANLESVRVRLVHESSTGALAPTKYMVCLPHVFPRGGGVHKRTHNRHQARREAASTNTRSSRGPRWRAIS